MRKLRCALLAAGAVVALGGVGRVAEGAVPPYSLVGSYQLPGLGAAFDVGPDGRLMAVLGGQILAQDAVNGSAWSVAGLLPNEAPISSFGASFLRISPDGQSIAIGDGRFGVDAHVYVTDTASLNPMSPSPVLGIATPNFQAHWRDNGRLLVTGANGPSVVNEITVGASTLTQRTVVDDIAGASGGVTTDGVYLYTGNGYSFGGGSATGEVRAFPLAAIDAALSPLSFESAGIPVAQSLSGSSLGFDGLGNMLIGGGDAFTPGAENGFAAVLDGAAIAAALGGGSPAAATLALTPDSATHSYSSQFNPVTNELLVYYFDNTSFTTGLTVYRYAVPAPGGALAVALGGALISRRRRRA
jgi:hypothetical protein